MDKVDMAIVRYLLRNSRLSYRELADRLNLSVNAVHKRIKGLIEDDIIREFTAKISLQALNAITVMVFGKSGANSLEEACKKLGEHEAIHWVSFGAGNYTYIGAFLRELSELEAFAEHVKETAQISDLTVGIIHRKYSPTNAKLYPLDYKIIYALHKNSRKPISEVAEELGVSAKTIRRRLSRMIQEGLIELSIEWSPDTSNNIIAIFHMTLRDSVDKKKTLSVLSKEYASNIIFSWYFSNIPRLVLCGIWTPTLKELAEIAKDMRRKEIFSSVTPQMIYNGYIFDTWRDKLLIEKAL